MKYLTHLKYKHVKKDNTFNYFKWDFMKQMELHVLLGQEGRAAARSGQRCWAAAWLCLPKETFLGGAKSHHSPLCKRQHSGSGSPPGAHPWISGNESLPRGHVTSQKLQFSFYKFTPWSKGKILEIFFFQGIFSYFLKYAQSGQESLCLVSKGSGKLQLLYLGGHEI